MILRSCAARPGLTAAAVSAAAVALGVAAGLPAPLAAALPVGPATTGLALLIVRPTLALRARPGRRWLHRGVRALGAGIAVSGWSMLAAGIADRFAGTATIAGTPLSAAIQLGGLCIAETLYLLGLALIPGVPLTVLGRVRRTLDGVSMGMCGFFIAWLLLFAREGVRGAALAAILMSCTTFCFMIVAGLRSAAGRSAAIACGGGIALSIAGLTQLTVALIYNGAANRYVVCGAALLAAPILIRRATAAVLLGGPTVDPVDSDTDFGGYPLLAVPLLAALVAWGYRFVRHDTFDTTSTALAVAAVVTVAVRGAVTSFDAWHYADRLTAREEHFRSLFSGSTDVIMVLDTTTRVRWQSPAAARQFGLSDQDVVGRPFAALVHADDSAAAADHLAAVASGAGDQQADPVESRLRDGFGGWRDVEWKTVDHRSTPAVAALVVHLRDIGDRRRLQHSLHQVTVADPLTGLPNRRRLSQAVAEHDGAGVLIMISLAGVSGVNDTMGIGAGDAVIAEAAYRIGQAVARTDLAARLDGDRFAVLTGAGAMQAQFLAARLLTILAEPYRLPGGPAHLSGGAGLAELTGGMDAHEVLRRAELALRPPEPWGRGGSIEWYDEAIEPLLRRRLAIERALPGFVDRSELELRFQPIVDLHRHRPVGVEAMPTWRHPELGVVAPEEYLPVAERLGIADEISDQVLLRGCLALAGWLRDGHDLWLSLNVSVARLAEPTVVPAIESIAERCTVPVSRLVIEVAEAGFTATGPATTRHSAGVDPVAEARTEAVTGHLAELRAMGIRVALDHFGTESTSLSRLRILPVDLLKVDRQLFEQPERRSGPGSAIIDAVVRLGKQLGMTVTAQGLATAHDLETALAAGCQFGQGDLLRPPVPADRFEAYLSSLRLPRS